MSFVVSIIGGVLVGGLLMVGPAVRFDLRASFFGTSEPETLSSAALPSPTSAPLTASGTPSNSGTGTPSSTPTPSSSPAGIADCAAAASAYVTQKVFHSDAAYHRADGNTLPIPADLVQDAFWRACPSEAAADATFWHYYDALKPSEICYVALSTSDSMTASLLSSWGAGVESLWVAGSVDDAAKRMVRVPANDGKGANNHLFNALAHVATLPATAACKWFITLGGDRNFVNPRAIQMTVQGLPHDTLKVFMGFIWKDMGFTDGVSAAAGSNMVLPRAAWDTLIANIGSNDYCKQRDDKDDSISIGLCLIKLGVAPTDLHLIDQSGALQQNGVPLEPGPPDSSRLSWLQQTPSRGGHWAIVDNMNSDKVNDMHNAFLALYGPWGKLPTVAEAARGASPSPSPATAANRDYAAATADTPACAVTALAGLRDLVDKGRMTPTAALPLPLDVAYQVTRDACSPKKTIGAPGVPHTATEHMCYVVSPNGGDVNGQAERLRNNWGSPMSRTKGDAKRQLWLAGTSADLPLGVFAVAGLDSGRGGRMSALKTVAADPDSAHCKFIYFGAFDDWVNAIAMTNVVRGLRSDVPLSVGFSLIGDKAVNGVEAPARGRVLYSRAALDILANRLLGGGGATCLDNSGDGEGDHIGVARCAWAAGIVPIHTSRFDVFNMGPSTDWAFQVPNYLLGLAMTIDQPSDRNQRIFCGYFFGTYGNAYDLVPWAASDWIHDSLVTFWCVWRGDEHTLPSLTVRHRHPLTHISYLPSSLPTLSPPPPPPLGMVGVILIHVKSAALVDHNRNLVSIQSYGIQISQKKLTRVKNK